MSGNLNDIDIKREYLALLEERANRIKYNRINTLFPDTGPLRRALYVKHLEFFRAGKEHKERLFLAANRAGKSEAGGYELALHLTGLYPKWWEGYRFNKPIKTMAAGDTGGTTRDIIQAKMLGEYNDPGTGMIPKSSLILDGLVRKSGIPNAYEQISVRHVNGWVNHLWLRSYEQGRKIFQGFEQDYIWLDEEVPEDVYSEALIRTMTTQGLMTMTYTPVKGLTKLTLAFMRDAGMVS